MFSDASEKELTIQNAIEAFGGAEAEYHEVIIAPREAAAGPLPSFVGS